MPSIVDEMHYSRCSTPQGHFRTPGHKKEKLPKTLRKRKQFVEQKKKRKIRLALDFKAAKLKCRGQGKHRAAPLEVSAKMVLDEDFYSTKLSFRRGSGIYICKESKCFSPMHPFFKLLEVAIPKEGRCEMQKTGNPVKRKHAENSRKTTALQPQGEPGEPATHPSAEARR